MTRLLTLAALAFSANLVAAESKPFDCSLAPGTVAIEQTVNRLTLSLDGKEVIQSVILGTPGTHLQVESDVMQESQRVIRGKVIADPQLSCAGSCGTATFTLTIQSAFNGITPNGQLIITPHSFSESHGPALAPIPSDFICQE